MGWPVRCNSPTAYLAGALAAKLAIKKGVKSAVLDMGLTTPTKNNIALAAAKGAVDAGLQLPFTAELDESRLKGEHIAAYAKTLQKAQHDKLFSQYVNAGIKPEELPGLFDKTKKKIMEA
jgi:large subunit ribosomal protein L18